MKSSVFQEMLQQTKSKKHIVNWQRNIIQILVKRQMLKPKCRRLMSPTIPWVMPLKRLNMTRCWIIHRVLLALVRVQADLVKARVVLTVPSSIAKVQAMGVQTLVVLKTCLAVLAQGLVAGSSVRNASNAVTRAKTSMPAFKLI